MRRPLGVALAGLLWAGSAVGGDADPVTALIQQLADDSYTIREQASQRLLGYGSDARTALAQAATGHVEPEARRRAGEILARIDRLAETRRLTTAPHLTLDYERVPLVQAVADLRARTGLRFTLDEAAIADPIRPVTVHTEALPVWAAIEAFYEAAGVRELMQETLPLPPAVTEPLAVNGRRVVFAAPLPPDLPVHVPIVLGDGRSTLAQDATGTVRVAVLPPDFASNRLIRGRGEVMIHLDVVPWSKLPDEGRWEGVQGVRIRQAIDDRGRLVAASHRQEVPAIQSQTPEVMVFGGMGAIPRVIWDDGFVRDTAPPTRPNPRLVPFTLHTGDREVKRLQLLEGVIVGEMTLSGRTLLTLEHLPARIGHTAQGPHEGRITIQEYQSAPAGRTILRVRSEAPNPWAMARPPRRGVSWTSFAIWDPAGAASAAAGQFRFCDNAGQSFSPSRVRVLATQDDGVRQVVELEFGFDPTPSHGPPETLILLGEQTITVEVPFRLRDVRLP